MELNRKEILKDASFEIDLSNVDREVFGYFRWRLHLGNFFIQIGFRILGVKAEFKGN